MATKDAAGGRGPDATGVEAATHPLPDRAVCEEILARMQLIRRFEERAGEMYAKAKIGGFLHLCIGEEATIVGSTQAMRDSDYLLSTYREHGHALARGTSPGAVMAELFGKVDGCSGGRGGSMHLFDVERRLLGGYGIVGGNLPLAAGVALASDYEDTDDATLCMFGDGATNQGTFGETMNLAALWKLPVVFMVVNNQFGMGTALERHSAVTDLSLKAAGYGVPGSRCDGMDVLDAEAVKTVDEAVEFAERSPFPDLASLYDDIYVIGDQIRQPWWSTDSRSPDVHRGEQEREAGEIAQELAEAGAAHADETDPETREARSRGAGG